MITQFLPFKGFRAIWGGGWHHHQQAGKKAKSNSGSRSPEERSFHGADGIGPSPGTTQNLIVYSIQKAAFLLMLLVTRIVSKVKNSCTNLEQSRCPGMTATEEWSFCLAAFSGLGEGAPKPPHP